VGVVDDCGATHVKIKDQINRETGEKVIWQCEIESRKQRS
jgi:hypothetical protein